MYHSGHILGALLAIAIVHQHAFYSVKAQVLTATECAAKLPVPRSRIVALYDNEDSIFLFGGSGGRFDATFKYSITDDKIEPAGQSPIGGYAGGAVMNKHGGIFYFPGAGEVTCLEGIIFQYFPENRTFTNVSTIPNNFYLATIMPDEDTALLIGGWCGSSAGVRMLNVNTWNYEPIQNKLPHGFIMAAAIWVEELGTAYIFGRGGVSSIQKFYRATNQSERLPQKLSIVGQPQAIWDGRHGYVIGGKDEHLGSIIQFDPFTETVTYLEVDGFPGGSGNNLESLRSTAAVYVKKLNRIYMFGGERFNGRYFDQISYISLDPVNPPTTTTTNPPTSTVYPIFDCVGRPDSVFPFPGDCSKFVICRDDHGYEFDCPDPLLFNPINRQCTFPDWAHCDQCY